MKITRIFLVTCWLALCLNSCDVSAISDGLYLHNKSNEAVSVFISTHYPDTCLYESKPESILTCVLPGASCYIPFLPYPYGGINYFDIEEVFPQDTVIVFIIDYELVQDVCWDSIRDNYWIKRRLDLDINELRKQDWRIIYE